MKFLSSALTLSLFWGMITFSLYSPVDARPQRSVINSVSAFAAGLLGGVALLMITVGDVPFAIVRMLVAALFLVLILIAAGAAFVAADEEIRQTSWFNLTACWGEKGARLLICMLAGMLTMIILAGSQFSLKTGLITAAAATAVALIVGRITLEVARLLPKVPFTPLSRFLLTAALLFCMAASSPRLDLFSPLSMKIMKFIHDFVHQFLESMLLPDHLFITVNLWELIGVLFGKEVGFWGGLIIWFLPAILISVAILRTPLPVVIHLRQGAQRRSLIAAGLRERRARLIIPLLAVTVLSWSLYRSLFPEVQYWDPEPISVEATADGEIILPLLQGNLTLNDGKIHKFRYMRGKNDVRFFVLYREGIYTVVLDACAICAPDGYGQGDGTVICYYCKTLIPLQTVGLPGGCNPVPVPSATGEDAVRIPAMQLVNIWRTTVQTTGRHSKSGGGR